MPTFTPPQPEAQSSPLSILITGTARGIGLELVRQYAAAHPSNVVVAAARAPSPALQALAAQHSNVHVVVMDVSDEASITASVAKVSAITPHLDLLYNNAGIHGPEEARDPLKASKAQLTEVFDTNVCGVVLVTRAYLPLLEKADSPKVVNVSSTMASNVTAVQAGQHYKYVSLTYGMSKAALNYATTAFRMAVPKVTFLAIHPGWVDTDMGSGGALGKAPDVVEDAVQAIRYHIAQKKLENSGDFFDVTTGNILPY